MSVVLLVKSILMIFIQMRDTKKFSINALKWSVFLVVFSHVYIMLLNKTMYNNCTTYICEISLIKIALVSGGCQQVQKKCMFSTKTNNVVFSICSFIVANIIHIPSHIYIPLHTRYTKYKYRYIHTYVYHNWFIEIYMFPRKLIYQ